jgi:hypothetical protein
MGNEGNTFTDEPKLTVCPVQTVGSSPYGNVPVFLHISHILEPIGSTRAFEKRVI